MIHDYCVIGAGIVGLATALELLRLQPDASIVIIEKERRVALHQTGHTSGVIHSGLYDKPGSVKATLCRQGASAMKAFCARNAISFKAIGKPIVATNPLELKRMEALRMNAANNGIKAQPLNSEALRHLEARARFSVRTHSAQPPRPQRALASGDIVGTVRPDDCPDISGHTVDGAGRNIDIRS